MRYNMFMRVDDEEYVVVIMTSDQLAMWCLIDENDDHEEVLYDNDVLCW